MENLEGDRLRIGFVVYGAMNRIDWRTVSADNIDFDATEFARQLIPTLRVRTTEFESKPTEYGARMVEECRNGLSAVLPFTDNERAFLDLLLDRGIVDAKILTPDSVLGSSKFKSNRFWNGRPLMCGVIRGYPEISDSHNTGRRCPIVLKLYSTHL